MPVLENVAQLAVCRAKGGQGDIHAIRNAALAWEGERLRWIGPQQEVPGAFGSMERIDAGGKLVVPGLIDCHTHLAFGGWRGDEFAQRIAGRSYLEIAEAGGGIAGTMHATRAASEDTLYERASEFLAAMVRLGVTTVEAKSGYGLNVADELKTLRVYDRLRSSQPAAIVSTFLGAHVVPPEYAENREGYLDLLCYELMPRVAEEGLADYCDAFLEESAFSTDEVRRIFQAAGKHGLGLKLHADQLSDSGGAKLAADMGAVSADHLEYISEEGIAAMAGSGTIAVSLPLASLYLNERPLPARRLISAGVPVAVATDFNPGTAPTYHLPLAMMLACTYQRMTPAEVLKGATLYAARAVGRAGDIGSLEAGKQADFVVVDAPDVNHWMYHFRDNAVRDVYIRGERITLI